jgi:hypothetical protein
MEDNAGWIKIHRKITKWEWYDDGNTFRLFIHLLLTANYESKKWHGIAVNRGELITSIRNLAKTLKLSEQKIKTSINKLKSTHEITGKSTNKYTIITICNYDSYQSLENQNNTQNNTQNNNQITNKQQTNNKQITTTKEYKEKRKESKISKELLRKKNIAEFSKNNIDLKNNSLLEDKKIITTKKITPKLFNNFWELYPKKIDKGKCLTLWTRICTRQDNVPTWSEIKKAIHYQKQSERWQDAKFIPHPSTWLNQSRWLDDPAEMKIVKFDYDKPKPKTTFGHLDAVTPIYEDDDSY